MFGKVSTVIFFTVCLLAGCGNGGLLGESRLSVTQRLREACRLLREAEILTLVESAENDRLAGLTKQEQLAGVQLLCPTSDCVVCFNAVVNQVYGF